jgi:pimeloyl-ACP methyl ester carboxylesterase
LKRLKKFWWVVLVVFFLAAAAGFVSWAVIVPEPMPEALAALKSDPQVSIMFDTTHDWWVFTPMDATESVGLIYYPGGKVDPRSYAPFARALAESGYLVVVPAMPLNLAVFAPDTAAQVMDTFREVEEWMVGGHSLGGAMAASFVEKASTQVVGLVLVASYPANNLSARTDLAVLSVYASLDGLASIEQITASRAMLPATAEFVRIEGGNHAQFGWYGEQGGDNPALISRAQQQEQLIEAVELALGRAANNQP